MIDNKTFNPCDLVIYGALGDLSKRKLFISLYRLEKANFIEADTRIIGVDRHDIGNLEFIETAYKSLQKFLNDDLEDIVWARFSARLSYLKIDLTRLDQYQQLNAVIDQKSRIMVNYFAVSPLLFKSICQGLAKSEILTENSRMVMEKPIGHDLKSSKEINNEVASVFNKKQVYRIDHYLGKETVLNLLALRPITSNNVEEKTVRGQYTGGYIKGNRVPGYLEEAGANTESTTESFVALRVDIDNWRWAGVPFYLRTGKRLTGKRSEIVVYFKQLPHNIFKDSFHELPPNKLIIHL